MRLRRRRRRRRTLAARGLAGLIYAAAIAWLASPTWRPPSPQAPPAGIERVAAAPSRIAVGRIAPAEGLPLALPTQQLESSVRSGAAAPSTGSSGDDSSGSDSQPSQGSSGGSTDTPTQPPSKRVVFEG